MNTWNQIVTVTNDCSYLCPLRTYAVTLSSHFISSHFISSFLLLLLLLLLCLFVVDGTLEHETRARQAFLTPPGKRARSDVDLITAEMQRLSLFAYQGDAFVRRLCTDMEFLAITDPETPLQPAELKRFWWVLISGMLRVEQDGFAPRHLHEGEAFGAGTEHEVGRKEKETITKKETKENDDDKVWWESGEFFVCVLITKLSICGAGRAGDCGQRAVRVDARVPGRLSTGQVGGFFCASFVFSSCSAFFFY